MFPPPGAPGSLGRALGSFLPRAVPLMLRANYRRELAAWCLLPIMLGTVEGGVVGVVAKVYFANVVPQRLLNLAVAVLTGAPSFANIVSYLWAAASHGRPKVRFLVCLQVAVCLSAASVALAPHSPAGLALFTASVVVARMCWSGVVTLRTTMWRANYPRHARARLAGNLATALSLAISAAGFVTGWLMKENVEAFRAVYPAAAAFGLVGAWVYSGVRMRGQNAWLRAERLDPEGSRIHPMQLVRVLLEDRRFRRYLTGMFLFGTGNIMVAGPLVVILRDRFDLNPFSAILIVSVIPMGLMPVSIPIWSRVLDRAHVVTFRAVHSWSFVASTACFLAACLFGSTPLLWLGAAINGVAFGGGVLGWNLGHHDFAPPQRAGQYMGLHVTLTGIRGLLSPLIGMGLYDLLEIVSPGSGYWVLGLCLLFSTAGAVWFGIMSRAASGSGPGGVSADGGTAFVDGPPVASAS